jgi:hypothetical protein
MPCMLRDGVSFFIILLSWTGGGTRFLVGRFFFLKGSATMSLIRGVANRQTGLQIVASRCAGRRWVGVHGSGPQHNICKRNARGVRSSRLSSQASLQAPT